MDRQTERKLLEREIEDVSEEIKNLGYQLGELLTKAYSFGAYIFDPEIDPDIDNVQDKMKKQEDRKMVFEHLKNHIDSCLKKLA